ncbi:MULTISPECIES: DUF1330 domain-containing protein [Rhizobium]|uniref:DUF1330 domain-containing protein n=1 Tax=Rhizobium tumorigenes TaxID=2041385 RepID=A0AAF1K529_9HYPH|nr:MULTISPECIES: DUF1330 domain-containing protein [Rhizobium]MBO9097761.1 DUF1330 domain-containing protein [Rhizobium sp. L58/93]MBO9133456.1 DUF1330 domain-containing protein [Rhizobium sp. B209b/85]MBO9167911.1 DUF1330 domain-containing protein [Rhizobium sp. L245/93]MBO9183956.1 DUF1330 domain-containing protein [Rhizobium sp. E27B/91]QXZ84190.1 DUF1330 domain-containing protein [Rhizobium sp. K1/93]
MSAYVVFVRDRITDPEEFATYGKMAPRAAEGREMKPLAFYGAVKTLEGAAVDGSVILEFPTMEAAQAWYDSPLYQEAVQHRFKGADYRVFIVEGVAG